jgi:hypothetical protein
MDDISKAQAANFAVGGSNWSGIRANLAEMERALGELQQQVDPVQQLPATHAEPSPAPIAAVAASIGAPGSIGAPASIDDGGVVPAVHAQMTHVTQMTHVKQQIDDLLRVREMLRESLRTAIGECEHALGLLERGEPLLGAVTSMVATQPANGDSSALGIALRPSVYRGSVCLRVGPLADISQVDTLEIALLQVPGAERVEIKEFAGRDAVAEIRLYQPVRLVEELHRVLPFTFEVTSGDAANLTLLATGEAGGGDLSSAAEGAAPSLDGAGR